MPNNRPLMKLSRDEDLFLRRWMYDEVHFQDGQGPAKRLQLQHGAVPADLAALVAAAIPDLAEQQEIAVGPPPADPVRWPWQSPEALCFRLAQVRTVFAGTNQKGPSR